MRFKKSTFVVCFFIVFQGIAQNFTIDSSRFFKTKSGCKIYSPYYDDKYEFDFSSNCVDGFAEGNGILTIYLGPDFIGSIEGEFKKGCPSGLCSFKRWDESVYEITFIDGRMWGNGTYKKTNGEIYTGQILDLNIHGFGEKLFTDGASFKGTFQKGLMWTGSFVGVKGDTVVIEQDEEVKRITPIRKYVPNLNVDVTEYFDGSWNRCEKAVAKYYRKVKYKNHHIPDGLVQEFFINGTLLQKCFYSYIDYEDEQLNIFGNGACLYYYDNGNLQFEGNANYRGEFEGRAITYHKNGNYSTIGNYDMVGNQDGKWAIFDEKGILTRYEVYENGDLSEGRYYDITEEGMWQLNSRSDIEDFESNTDFWIGAERFPRERIIDPDLYIVSVKETPYIKLLSLSVSDDLTSGLYLYAKALNNQIGSRGSFGIIYDYKSSSEYYTFQVNNKNEAFLSKHLNGKEEIVFKAKLSKEHQIALSKKSSSYYFAVVFHSDRIDFMLNEQLITKLDYNGERGDSYGIYGAGGASFGINSLESTEFFSKEESESYTRFVMHKIVNYNPSEYDGNGSGFFISRVGHLVTNYHVVEDVSEIIVKVNINGKEEKLPAKILVKDKVNDLVILKIDQKGFDLGQDIPYSLDFKTLDVGEEVFTLGYPMVDVMGEEQKFTDGRISAKSGIDGDITTYQITTPIQPGNSGGPLFDSETGNVIGIVSSFLNRDKFNAENVNYALKSNLLKNLIDSSPEVISIKEPKIGSGAKLSELIKSYKPFVPLIFTKE
jgi:S1-C subfamily serine protease